MASHDRLYLGVDGGGTKTTAWLGQSERDNGQAHIRRPRIVGRGTAGPGNPRSVGFESALQHIHQAVLAAFADARMPLRRASSACFCLAGAGRQEEQQRIAGWVNEQGIADSILVVGDVEAVLATFSEPPGGLQAAGAGAGVAVGKVALICGTGSIALGTSPAGKWLRCGGWGYLCDDLGSGFWLGQQALALACQTADGRQHEQGWLETVLRKTNCTQPQELVEWTYAHADCRQRIAGLAQLVFESAAKSAPCAAIIDQGAQRLAELVRTIIGSLEIEQYMLAMAGGVLCKQPVYAERVQQALRQSDCQPLSVQMVPEPALGALNLAMKEALDSTGE